jgi:tRNA dimethylallyltransferase
MAVGTAQPTPEQLSAVPHYFIADREPGAEYNSGIFASEARELLEKLFAEHTFVVAVGGSGLYIDALCYGLDDLPSDKAVRAELERQLADEGVEALARMLTQLDPEYYSRVDINNPARVMRALEVCLVSRKPYSAQRSGRNIAERGASGWHLGHGFDVVKIGLSVPRAELYDRINRRVDTMLDAGLVDEARALLPHRALNSLNTVGYKELFAWMDGSVGFEEAVELIKRNSRRYAKRQLTWFGRDPETVWFSPTDIADIEDFVRQKRAPSLTEQTFGC